jgi:hypothetical protein
MLSNPVAIVSSVARVVALWQLALRWRTHRIDDVRQIAGFMRTIFGDVIAHGGLRASAFLADDARSNETALKDIRAQVRDGKLGARLDRLMECWKDAFANAPPARPLVSWVAGDSPPIRDPSETAQRRAQGERQVQAARNGEGAVDDVLARCVELEHWIVSP